MSPQPPGARAALGLAERPAPARRVKAAARPAAQRHRDFTHLSLDALRDCRAALVKEEGQVSYWRRILQARLDVVRQGRLGTVDDAHLRPVLTDARVRSGRTALLQVLQVDDIPPLPSLAALWDRRVAADDHEGLDLLEADLLAAERQLSDYRQALHRRIADATGELIARYRDQPGLCLSALPLGAGRRERTG